MKVPYVSVIHDMALTHQHVVIPFGGYVTSAERLKEGKIHWGWDATKPSMIGVIPRGGSAKDMRWFKGPERCMMHTFNAHSEGNKVILYAPFYDSNFFPFFPPVDGSPWNPAKAKAFIRKITLDLDKRGTSGRRKSSGPSQVGDLGKVDPRFMTLETRYLYTLFSDDDRPMDRAKRRRQPVRPATNSYGRFDVTDGEVRTISRAPRTPCRNAASCRAAKQWPRRAMATWSAWRRTTPRCARSWSLRMRSGWGRATSRV